LILNKQTLENAASFIFQSNWEVIAEFGVLPNNNFVLKVANGGVWMEAFAIDPATGAIDFKQDVLKNGKKIF
jgi:hypothetical protein